MQTDVEQLIASLPGAAVVRATRLGLALAPNLEAVTRRELFSQLSRLARTATGERHTVTTWLGDLLAYGGPIRRGQIAAFANATGLDAGTLRNAKMVCQRIPLSRRHDTLSWSHHCEVGLAFADPAEIEHWLAIAEHEKVATAELRRRIRLHVATSSRGTNAAESAKGFRLMRELRAAARAAEQLRTSVPAVRAADLANEALAATLHVNLRFPIAPQRQMVRGCASSGRPAKKMNPVESDWKKFRAMTAIWREPYLAERNARLVHTLTDPKKTETERFWEAEKQIQKEAKTLYRCLDDISRSKMWLRLIEMRAAGMLKREDLADFP